MDVEGRISIQPSPLKSRGVLPFVRKQTHSVAGQRYVTRERISVRKRTFETERCGMWIIDYKDRVQRLCR